MQRQRDLFKYIQDRKEEFNEHPSHAAWRKLERRLDNHQQRNRSTLFRSLSMVAGVLLLVGFAFLFVLLTDNMGNQSTNADYALGVELETLDVELTPETYEVVEFALKHRDRMSNIIDEGTPDKELIAKKVK